MKAREFWISTNTGIATQEKPNYTKDYYAMYKVIHVREVVPIDWEQVWEAVDFLEFTKLNRIL